MPLRNPESVPEIGTRRAMRQQVSTPVSHQSHQPLERHTAPGPCWARAPRLPSGSVDPSSLIFVVIIGIWALYLLQHWVRRREQVATSRSVDRFSEAMRVLERRAPIPIEQPARSTPSVRRRGQRGHDSQRGPPGGRHAGLHPEGPERPARRCPRSTRSRVDRLLARRCRGAATHRLRALILLTLLVATPSVWAAHEFGTLLLWPTVLVSVAFVLDLLLVRSAVRQRAGRSPSRDPAGRSARSPARTPGGSAGEGDQAPQDVPRGGRPGRSGRSAEPGPPLLLRCAPRRRPGRGDDSGGHGRDRGDAQPGGDHRGHPARGRVGSGGRAAPDVHHEGQGRPARRRPGAAGGRLGLRAEPSLPSARRLSRPSRWSRSSRPSRSTSSTSTRCSTAAALRGSDRGVPGEPGSVGAGRGTCLLR